MQVVEKRAEWYLLREEASLFLLVRLTFDIFGTQLVLRLTREEELDYTVLGPQTIDSLVSRLMESSPSDIRSRNLGTEVLIAALEALSACDPWARLVATLAYSSPRRYDSGSCRNGGNDFIKGSGTGDGEAAARPL